MRIRFATALLMLSLIAIPILVVAGGPVQNFPNSQPLNTIANPADLGWHESDSGSYGEAWFFEAMDDKTQTTILGLLSVSNYHPTEKMASTVDIFVYTPDGQEHHGHGEYKKENFSAAKTGLQAKIGNNTVTGSPPNYKAIASEGGVSANLSFTSLVPATVLGGDKIYFGEKNQEIWADTVLSGLAKVSGTVTINGQSISISGRGYMDHGYSDIKVPEFSKDWYIMRLWSDPIQFNCFRINLKKGYSQPTIGVFEAMRDGKYIMRAKNFTLTPKSSQTHAKSGIAYETSFDFSAGGSKKNISGTITMKQFLSGLDVLSVLSAPVRLIIKAFYTNPWQFKYLAEYDLVYTEEGQDPVPVKGIGIVEVHKYK